MEKVVGRRRGRLLVPPRNCGVRRHKALAPWRFQPGYVRRQVKGASLDGSNSGGDGFEDLEGVFDLKGCGFGGSESECNAKGCGLERLGSDCNAKDGGLEGMEMDGEVKDCNSEEGSESVGEAAVDSGFQGSGSNGVHQSCKLERSGSNGVVEDCDLGFESGDGAKDCNLDGSESNGRVEDCKLDGLKSSGAEKDCNLEGVKSAGASLDSILDGLERYCAGKGGGLDGSESNVSTGDCKSKGLERNGRAGDYILDGLKSDCMGKGCYSEGLQSSGAAKDNNMEGRNSNEAAKDCNLEGFESNGAAKENNAAAKDCNLEGLGSNGAARDCNLAGSRSSASVPICRKGRKALAPWRFQLGYKRSFLKAFDLSDGSVGSLGTPESRIHGTLRQHTPATGSAAERFARSCHSGVRVSATCDFSSQKDETSAASKKRRIEKDYHYQVKPKNGVVVTRESVVESLREFQRIYRKLMEEEESKWRETGHGPRPDLVAFKIFREGLGGEIIDRKYVGSVPGIQIGDVFHLRVELCIVGLHRQHRMGIDFIKEEDGTCIAVSIVSYVHSSDAKNNLDVLVYCGSMVATSDQKIDGTNLALKRSMDTNTPVRVIHGFITYPGEKFRPKKLATYIYGGLYQVEKYWREKESEDRYVYMFRLRRMTGQRPIDIQEILKSRKPETFFGIFMEDISQGQEKIPISVVNSISDEYPMPYQYISQLKYSPQYHPSPPAGCDCVDGCSDSEKCACAMKNGGEIPFNDKGAIVEAKPLVYECGPSCKCPPTCHNRVSQHGMKFRLQVFKTKSMGWGVRSLNFIPSGSFVCEYIGELLEDEEAQKRTNDEYLFAIGNNYYDESLWEGLSRSIPSLQKGPSEDEEGGFAVDASKCGNFARFINHSCSPNLYAQNVLYDHDNKSMPHIMFFACEDIPPLQELSYHYNYTIDQVHDSNGNIKKKKCLCGSVECTGWLY